MVHSDLAGTFASPFDYLLYMEEKNSGTTYYTPKDWLFLPCSWPSLASWLYSDIHRHRCPYCRKGNWCTSPCKRSQNITVTFYVNRRDLYHTLKRVKAPPITPKQKTNNPLLMAPIAFPLQEKMFDRSLVFPSIRRSHNISIRWSTNIILIAIVRCWSSFSESWAVHTHGICYWEGKESYNLIFKHLTAFLIGRFIGTFLPSTIGLDDSHSMKPRYSNEKTRVAVAKVLEKFVGITGLFLGMVVTLHLAIRSSSMLLKKSDAPMQLSHLLEGIALVAGGISSVVIVGLIKPGLLEHSHKKQPIFFHKVSSVITSFSDAVFAYEGKLSLIVQILSCQSYPFTTAVVYFFTALAIGAIAVGMSEFWPIVFGSNIQILATILSPTIAGEGAREAFQALLLEKRLGGIPQAVLSGALGFVAAEAATMWGGACWWTRQDSWRPSFMLVDGAQVDYSWLEETTDVRRKTSSL